MLTNFPAKKIYLSGGYRSFQFVPVNKVLSYPMISAAAAVVAVGLSSDAAWYQGYATDQTLSYTEEQQVDANGKYFNLIVSGFIPGDSQALITLISEMEIYRHLLTVKDSRGFKRLIGSPAAPLDFSANFNSGTGRSDQKGFTFQFTGQSLYRAPIYNW